ncbi:MAG: DUF1249 domain-containing protein [Methanoregula sp.]|jgi:hypothetical protein|nr:DUF1249 domain-containing protein [Methanoregula sp.]
MFDKLQKIGLLDQAGRPVFKEHAKIVHKPYMDLSIDRLSSEHEGTIRISIAHNFIQNGDVMADPDMEIRIYPELKAVEALTYQLDSLGIFQCVYPEPSRVYPKRKTELNRFLNQWLTNLIDQGFYLPQKAEHIEPITEIEILNRAEEYRKECEKNRAMMAPVIIGS